MPGMPDPTDGEEPDGSSVGEQLVAGGIDPADVADQVAEAMRVGRFWVLTHPTTLDVARRRWDAIAADGQPSGWDVVGGAAPAG